VLASAVTPAGCCCTRILAHTCCTGVLPASRRLYATLKPTTSDAAQSAVRTSEKTSIPVTNPSVASRSLRASSRNAVRFAGSRKLVPKRSALVLFDGVPGFGVGVGVGERRDEGARHQATGGSAAPSSKTLARSTTAPTAHRCWCFLRSSSSSDGSLEGSSRLNSMRGLCAIVFRLLQVQESGGDGAANCVWLRSLLLHQAATDQVMMLSFQLFLLALAPYRRRCERLCCRVDDLGPAI